LPPHRRCFITFLIFHSHSFDILVGLLLHGWQTVKVKSLPHAAFPSPVIRVRA
jgi:hypothetical protein